jgi:hypothetical protein
MAQRADLLAEIDTTLDGSGDYTGDWIDSSEIYSVRVLYSGVGTQALIQESANQTNVLSTSLPVGFGEVPITARYFRFAVDGGSANATLRATVRTVGS